MRGLFIFLKRIKQTLYFSWLPILVFLPVFLFIPNNEVQASEVTTPRLLELINNNREKNSLAPLAVNHELTQAALKKARDLLARGYFAHTTPDGKPFYAWIEEERYDYLYAGENLAIDFFTSEEMVEAWLASPTHRANIMNEHYNETGMAVVKGLWQGRETIVAVQMFGLLMSDNKNLKSTVLGKTIDFFDNGLEKRKKELAQVASDLVLLPNLAGRKYLDIFINPKTRKNWQGRVALLTNLSTGPNTNIEQPITQALVETKPPCCGRETGLVITTDENGMIISTPILLPTLSQAMSNIKTWPIKMPSVSSQPSFNLFLACVTILLLLAAYKDQIKLRVRGISGAQG